MYPIIIYLFTTDGLIGINCFEWHKLLLNYMESLKYSSYARGHDYNIK